MKTLIVILLFVLAEVIGNTCLSAGMKQVASAGFGDGGLSIRMIFFALATPLIWVGIVLLLGYFALFAAALSWADLSFVLPASAFKYILNVAFAGWFLGEPISTGRWAGTVLICIGVMLVVRTAGDRSVATEPEVRGGLGEGGRS
ncbi:MAG: EamA family transporter [Syntrophobacteraceae bacterium]